MLSGWGADDLDGAGGVAGHRFCDAAEQEALDTVSTLGSEHDEIGFGAGCFVEDGCADVSDFDRCFDLDSFSTQLRCDLRDQGFGQVLLGT